MAEGELHSGRRSLRSTLVKSSAHNDWSLEVVVSIVLLVMSLACVSPDASLTCGEGTTQAGDECIATEVTAAPADTGESDDTSAPVVEEVCTDAADNDRDGYVDCADQDCADHASCDADADGYSRLSGDCDDQDAAVSPVGQDGLMADRDCDGMPAAGTLELAEHIFLGERARDWAGYWVATAGDVDGDGLDDVLVGAYDVDTTGESAGAAYLILGKSLVSGGALSLSSADYILQGEEAGDWAGFVAESGDVDGDGLDDLLISAYGAADKGPLTGAVYVVLARSLGSESVIDLEDADYKIIGESNDDYSGYALGSGDVDGDGFDDILIGASGHDAGGVNAGAAYVVLASSLGSESVVELSDADHKLIGESPDSWAGYSLASAGDVDGDGRDDIVLGADDDDGGWQAHAAYLIYASTLDGVPTLELAAADHKFRGETGYDYASQVSSAGDVDGDGRDDLIIGAAGQDSGGSLSGAAYVILASSLGASSAFDLSDADYILIGERPGDYAGAVVSDAGDVDGDGLGDVMVGALHYEGQFSEQGAAYVVLGSQLGTNPEVYLSDAAHQLLGSGPDDYAGVSVAGAGDVDGDGLDDVILGGYRGPNWTGVAYLVTGG